MILLPMMETVETFWIENYHNILCNHVLVRCEWKLQLFNSKVSDRSKPAPLKSIQKRILSHFLHTQTHAVTIRCGLFNSPVRSFLSHLSVWYLSSSTVFTMWSGVFNLSMCVCDCILNTISSCIWLSLSLWLVIFALFRYLTSCGYEWVSIHIYLHGIHTALDGATHRSVYCWLWYSVSVVIVYPCRCDVHVNFFDFIIIVSLFLLLIFFSFFFNSKRDIYFFFSNICNTTIH